MPNRLEQTVTELIQIDGSQEYQAAKDLQKNRKEYTEIIKEELKNESEIDIGEGVYAGLKKTRGRISWKSVVEKLAQQYNISETALNEIIEDHRSVQHRIKYGSTDEMGQKRIDFSDYLHFTPS